MFELSLVPMILIIMFFGNQPERLSSSVYFLMYTGILSIPYLVLVLSIFPSFSFSEGLKFLPSSLMGVLLLFPFLVKMPVMGLHFWLPKAHVEASTSGSMVLAGLLLKLGGYGALRLFILASSGFPLLLSFWMVSALMASALTCLQSDVKKLIAYSSVTHMTFLMVGLACNGKIAFLSLVLVSLAHGWASMGMFFSGGAFSHSSFSRIGVLLSPEGTLHLIPLCLGILLIANASVPPMPSFFPEVAMVWSLTSVSFSLSLFFVMLSFTVCYYNSYLFLWTAQIKATTFLKTGHSLSELVILIYFISTSLISLGFLSKL